MSNDPTQQPTHGLKPTTASRRRPAPNPQKVAQMLADSVELAPTVVIPLEVKTGSRNVCHDSPSDGGAAMINVTNREDGHEYLVLVIRK